MPCYLRIAVTVLSLTACVMLVALWKRSYWWTDGINGQLTSKYCLGVGSMPGCFGTLIYSRSPRPSMPRWTITTRPTDQWLASARHSGPFIPSRIWGAFYCSGLSGFVLPYWFGLTFAVVIATAPWIRWSKRFSLRTLLIATTLVAAGLGLIVAFAR